MDQFTATPDIEVTGADRAVAEIEKVSAAGDRLSKKKFEPQVSLGNQAASALDKAPWWLGPAVGLVPAAGALGGAGLGAAAGLGGAFAAGTGAVTAFAAVAKPVLTDALTAEQAVSKAQDAYNVAIASGTKQSVAYAAEQKAINTAYADMSPAQIALSKQLGAISDAWEQVQKAETPVIAGALQPWLKTVTDLIRQLAPVVSAAAGAIKEVGTQFDILVTSSAFRTFLDFVAKAGSQTISAVGNLLTGFLDALVTLLPKLNPLIEATNKWLSGLGDSIARWANSQKTADQITAFMDWFRTNGPVVGQFLVSIGKALAALLPGLTEGGALELKVITQFLDWVAKIPKGIAGPLAEVAGAALILSKLPGGTKVISFAVDIVGKGVAALLRLVGLGGVAEKLGIDVTGADTAAASIRAAMVSGGEAAAAEIRAAMVGGGAVAAGEEAAGEAAGVGAVGGGFLGGAKSLGGKALGGAALGAGAYFGGSAIVGATTQPGTTGQKLGQVGVDTASGALAGLAFGPIGAAVGAAIGLAVGLLTQFHAQVAKIFDQIRHDTANVWDGWRHDIARFTDLAFTDTIGSVIRFGHNIETQFNSVRHEIAVIFDGVRHDISHAWDLVYSDTIGSLIRFGKGVGNNFDGVKTWIETNFIKPVIDLFTITLPDGFSSAVQSIGKIWDNIEGAIAKPVTWALNNSIGPGSTV